MPSLLHHQTSTALPHPSHSHTHNHAKPPPHTPSSAQTSTHDTGPSDSNINSTTTTTPHNNPLATRLARSWLAAHRREYEVNKGARAAKKEASAATYADEEEIVARIRDRKKGEEAARGHDGRAKLELEGEDGEKLKLKIRGTRIEDEGW